MRSDQLVSTKSLEAEYSGISANSISTTIITPCIGVNPGWVGGCNPQISGWELWGIAGGRGWVLENTIAYFCRESILESGLFP